MVVGGIASNKLERKLLSEDGGWLLCSKASFVGCEVPKDLSVSRSTAAVLKFAVHLGTNC